MSTSRLLNPWGCEILSRRIKGARDFFGGKINLPVTALGCREKEVFRNAYRGVLGRIPRIFRNAISRKIRKPLKREIEAVAVFGRADSLDRAAEDNAIGIFAPFDITQCEPWEHFAYQIQVFARSYLLSECPICNYNNTKGCYCLSQAFFHRIVAYFGAQDVEGQGRCAKCEA